MTTYTRRTILKFIAGSGLGALVMPPLSQAFAAEAEVQDFYRVEGFSEADYATICQLARDIIPEDEDAGAGSPEILNQICVGLLALPDSGLEMVRHGIGQVNDLSRNVFGAEFYELDEDSRVPIIEAVSSSPATAAFWFHVRSTTTFVFYADPIGYLPIGLPGPNVDANEFWQSGHESAQGRCDGLVA